MTQDTPDAPDSPRPPAEAGASAESPPTAETPPPRRGLPPVLSGLAGGVVGGVLVVLIAAGLGAVNVGPLRQALLAPAEQRLGALDQRLSDIESHLAALERRPAAAEAATTGATPSEPQGLAQRLAAVEAQLRSGTGDPRLAGDVGRLKDDIESLRRAMPPEGAILRLADRAQAAEQQLRDLANRRQSAEALLLVIGQLRDAVDRGDPYQAELQAARRVAPPEEAPQFDLLAPAAASGIQRRSVLLARFPALANAVVRAAVAPPDGGFWQRSLAKLTQLVSLRRIDGQGEGTAAVVARAEQQVKDGDLAKAVGELSALEGAPAAQAQAWIAAARTRIAADRALSELTAATAAQIAKTGG